MLIGFLVRDEEDWKDWRRSVKHVQGKTIIHVSDHDPVAQMKERGTIIDEVETLSDEDNDMQTVKEVTEEGLGAQG
jgi:cysteine protease ATG4